MHDALLILVSRLIDFTLKAKYILCNTICSTLKVDGLTYLIVNCMQIDMNINYNGE